MILGIRRARRAFALCSIPAIGVWVGLVAASALLHAPGGSVSKSERGHDPNGSGVSLLAWSGGRVAPDGACAACAFAGSPVKVGSAPAAAPAGPAKDVLPAWAHPASPDASPRPTASRSPPAS